MKMKRQKRRGKVGESVTIHWKINKRKKKKLKIRKRMLKISE